MLGELINVARRAVLVSRSPCFSLPSLAVRPLSPISLLFVYMKHRPLTYSLDITYSASILLTSTEPHYILANLSWLVGAIATIAQDLFVLGQFAVYSWQDKNARETKMLVEAEQEEDDQA